MPLPATEGTQRLADLMHRVAVQDGDAFAALYKSTSAKLYGVILRILKRRALADEILQDVYIRIWQVAGEYDATKGSPITWMVSIARNRAIDEARRATAVSLEDMPEALEIASSDPDELAELASKQDMQRLLHCMGLLDSERRDMVMLAYFHGLSREALATKYGRPVATIKTWLHRSLAQLKDCVGQ